MSPDPSARLPSGPRWRTAAVLAAGTFGVYLVTLVAPAQINIDAEPSAMPAWHLVQHGTIDLGDMDTNDNPFIVPARHDRLLSNRSPGLWLVAVPAYLLTNDSTYSPTPSSVTAALLAAAAIAAAYLLLRELLPEPWALGGALLLAFGTATWPISSGQLWPHAPAQLLLLLGLLAVARARVGWAGVALGLTVLIRPIVGIVPVCFALRAVWQRRYRDAACIAVPTAVAAAAAMLYSQWAFGELSLTGGQGAVFRDYPSAQSPIEYLGNVVAMLVSPTNGFLVWSPWVLFALLGVRGAWAQLPGWGRTAVLAAAVYGAVHLRLSPASGGLPFDYRYPLEPLTLCLPLLVLGVRHALGRSEMRRRALVMAVAASVVLQGLMAQGYECTHVPGRDSECSVL